MSFFSHRVKRRMGGARKIIEPPSCVQLKKDTKIWRLIEKGGVPPYIERLHGRNKDTTTYFKKHWKDGTIILHGCKVIINEILIA